MSDYNSRRISEAELAVLEVLWDAAEPLPAKGIQEQLKERRGWERTTVRTLLTRLSEKGTVNVDKTDVALYSPAFTRDQYAWDLVEVLLERMFDGDGCALVKCLLSNGSVTTAQLSELAF